MIKVRVSRANCNTCTSKPRKRSEAKSNQAVLKTYRQLLKLYVSPVNIRLDLSILKTDTAEPEQQSCVGSITGDIPLHELAMQAPVRLQLRRSAVFDNHTSLGWPFGKFESS